MQQIEATYEGILERERRVEILRRDVPAGGSVKPSINNNPFVNECQTIFTRVGKMGFELPHRSRDVRLLSPRPGSAGRGLG